jgi:hypothetical protein
VEGRHRCSWWSGRQWRRQRNTGLWGPGWDLGRQRNRRHFDDRDRLPIALGRVSAQRTSAECRRPSCGSAVTSPNQTPIDSDRPLAGARRTHPRAEDRRRLRRNGHAATASMASRAASSLARRARGGAPPQRHPCDVNPTNVVVDRDTDAGALVRERGGAIAPSVCGIIVTTRQLWREVRQSDRGWRDRFTA